MKYFESILIKESIPNGRISGQLFIRENHIEFVSEVINISINFDSLDISTGGSGNRLIFFINRLDPSFSIYTSDKKVLKEKEFISHSKLKSDVKVSIRNNRKFVYGTLAVISVVILSLFGLYASKDIFVEKLSNQVPVEWEKKAGDQIFASLSSKYKLVENDSLKSIFLEVANPLLKVVRKEGVSIDLYFVEDPSINAFALPGGKVIIQSGLIQNAKSWEEVLGVLSHELAHVTRRHHIRGAINNLGLYALISAFVGDMSAIAATITNMGGELASLSNSREFEIEADETGLEYLTTAGIDPSGMISFFETLNKKEGVSRSNYLSFLSTHPNTKERITNLKEKTRIKKSKNLIKITDFKSFKSKFNSKL